ncbi:MAG: PAS domain S-box protein [Elusimicrobiota bacterium]|nr:PAS domain S-box protein [Elusimicrobiota bacterium]
MRDEENNDRSAQNKRAAADDKELQTEMGKNTEWCRMLFDQVRDVILVLELQDGGLPVIRDVNKEAVRVFGYTREELCGQPISLLEAEVSSEAVVLERTRRTKRDSEQVFEVRHRRKDGTTFEAEALATEMMLDGKRMAISIERDISERKLAEKAAAEAYDIQTALNAMLQGSLPNTPLREKLGNHLASLFALPWLAVQPKGAVFLINTKGDALVLTAQQGLNPYLLKACANVPLGHCLCGKAAESGQVVESACVGADHPLPTRG